MRHRAQAGMWRAMEAKATSIAATLAEAQETRRQWEALTEPTRRTAIAADLELRRRHPATTIEPLTSAEPADGTPTAMPRNDPTLAPAQREARGHRALGLTAQTVLDPVPGQIHRIRENARKAQAEIDRLRSTPQFAEDDDSIYIGPAWGNLAPRDRDAILQPPKPDIIPARAVLQRAQERQAAREPEHA